MPNIQIPKKEIFIFVASFILSFLSFLIVSKVKINFGTFQKQANLTTKNVPTSAPSNTPSPSPTPSIKREEVKIKILNGSGIKGKASEVKDILKNSGYLEILTANADSFDYTKTELQVKKSKIEAAQIVKADLKNSVEIGKVSNLNENEAADVVIIIGQDFK